MSDPNDDIVRIGIIGITGDFDNKEIRADLQAAFADITATHPDCDYSVTVLLDDRTSQLVGQLASQRGWRVLGITRRGEERYDCTSVDELRLVSRGSSITRVLTQEADVLVCLDNSHRNRLLRSGFAEDGGEVTELTTAA